MDYLFLFLGLALLLVGANYLVDASVAIAQRAKISNFIIGLTIVGIGTSAPELFVSIQSALTGHGDIAMGNVLGSNIANVFLIMGVTAIILPFEINRSREAAEQEERLSAQDEVLVYLYLDRSGRLSATSRIYNRLSPAKRNEFREEDPFTGVVYRIEKNYGVFVAVEPKQEDPARRIFGLIPSAQVFRKYRLGETVSGRVVRVREDGKLDLSVRARDYEQIARDTETILKKIDEYGGVLPFSESASPEIIRRELQRSKNGFKKALGSLLKAGKIRIGEKEVTLLSDHPQDHL